MPGGGGRRNWASFPVPPPKVDQPRTLLASLQGARVLLTGASAGVGEELAYHYARLGSHLVLTAHTEALLQKVRQPISS